MKLLIRHILLNASKDYSVMSPTITYMPFRVIKCKTPAERLHERKTSKLDTHIACTVVNSALNAHMYDKEG